MTTISDRFTKKSREFLRRIVNISQDLDTAQQTPLGSTLESKPESKGDSDKRTQALTSSRPIRAMSPQVHEVYDVEIEEHGTASENDEKSNDEDHDDRSESEQTMVPFGKYPIGKRCVKAAS